MRKLNYLLLFVLASFAFACSDDGDDEPKLKEKAVTVEVEMDGNYSDYLVIFSTGGMLSGTSTFVAPELVQPSGLEWTQIVEQANSYTVSFEPTESSILVNSASKIHSMSFNFTAVPLDNNQDESFEPLTATIRILTDGSLYKEYSFEALPAGQVSNPVSDILTFE